MFKIIVLDQFTGPNPYQLQQHPLDWKEFEGDVAAGRYDGYTKPLVIEHATENYEPPFATTTYREGKDGRVEAWKMRWDSSG